MQTKLDAISTELGCICWCESDFAAFRAMLTTPGALTTLWAIIREREDADTEWRRHFELTEVVHENDR